MPTVRIAARLDIKSESLVKTIHLEGLRKLGDPAQFALDYYRGGVDELIYIDVVASLYGRNSLNDIIRHTCRDVFTPLTVGGGMRELADIENALRSGADKIALNSAAVRNPDFLTEAANKFGAQCCVLSIDAKKRPDGWEAFLDNGREPSGVDAIDWARRGVELGAGEILITSIDQEGTRKGFDTGLVEAVRAAVSVPVIASGGYGKPADLLGVIDAGADAVAIAHAFHFKETTVPQLKQFAAGNSVAVRL